ncbi:MAG: EAL domain-containing protein [Clostridia bacterium]
MEELLGRHIISLFLVFLFAVRLGSQRSARDRELRYFWLTVVSCFLLIIEDQAESWTAEDPGLITLRILLSVAGYVLRSTATIGLVLVVCRPEERTRALWIPVVINALVCSTAFFTDIAFGYDADYRFYRGPLGYVAFIVPIFYLILILWMTFRRYADSRKKAEIVILVSCAVLCLASALLDSRNGGVRLHEAIMISSIFFYVFLRSYDLRRDSLTLLLNRQSLYDDCKALGKSICAAASMDMNGLKSINNMQGHSAGDAALKKIGECITAGSDQDARSYRIGGDEFVILYFRRDEDTFRAMLERIRESVKAAGYSIAYGYAMREDGDDPERVIRRSDQKMFEHKARYYNDIRHDRRRRRAREENSHSAETWKATEDLPQPVAVYRFADHKMETLAVSDGFCRLFGFPDRASAKYILDNETVRDIHTADQERVSGALLRFSDGKEDLDIVYRTRSGIDSDYRVIHARGSHLHTETGERIAHVWYMDEGVYVEGEEDTGTELNRALNQALHEESILNATHYDGLTGLPNLAWFFKLYEAGKARMLSEGKQCCLLYLDLNGMKYFNHRNGFAEGDKLLKAFAEQLTFIFGKEHSCHVAADHFAACSPEAETEEKIRRLFEETRRMNGGRTLPVRAGVYSTSIENVAAAAAYDRAKMACDTIRKSDTSAFIHYREEMREAMKRQQYIVANIDLAIEEKWVQVYYQPIVSAETETKSDEEALARWIDPTEGFLSPAFFIPFLENAGLIYKLDLCILEQVLEKIRGLQEAGREAVPHSINLSRSDFDACDIVEEIRKRVDAAGVDHQLITIEITESVIGRDFEFMKERVCRFRELGFKVWMDDFGSGYSSLDVLRDFQFDLIKFDMSFMRKLDEGENGKIILTALMKMANELKLDTVCEGVETEEQVRFLQKIGCSKLQGFFFGKPAPFNMKQDKTEENENVQH